MDKIVELLKEIEESIEKLCGEMEIKRDKVVVAYRGESEDFGVTKLTPTLFRDSLVAKEIFAFEYLKDHKIIDKNESNFLHMAIEAQHYAQTSRLLDISFNPLKALYFSLLDTSNEKDAKFYVFAFPKHFSANSEYLSRYYKYMLEENEKILILNENFRVIRKNLSNERITNQEGGFIFFPGTFFSKLPENFYKIISISGKDKLEIKKYLEKNFGFSIMTLYPEKEHVHTGLRDFLKSEIDNNVAKDFHSIATIEINYYFYLVELELNSMKNRVEKLRKIRFAKNEVSSRINELESSIEMYGEKIDVNELKKLVHDKILSLKGVHNGRE